MHISSHLTARDLEGTTWNPTPRHCTTWCMVVVMPLERERRQEKADGCQEPESRTCWPWSPNDSRQMSYPQNQKDLRPKMREIALLPPRAESPNTQDYHKATMEGRPCCCSCLLAATSHNYPILRRKESFEIGICGAAPCPDMVSIQAEQKILQQLTDDTGAPPPPTHTPQPLLPSGHLPGSR